MTATHSPVPASCPLCGGEAHTKMVREVFPYATPQGEVSLTAQVPYDHCAECGYTVFGEDGERARTEAIYRHIGRLSPWEISSIRENLGLSQADFADRLGVGKASLERWERGVNMQNQSMDNLILLLSEPTHKSWLDGERAKRARADLVDSPVVNLERFRALCGKDPNELADRQAKFRLRRSA